MFVPTTHEAESLSSYSSSESPQSCRLFTFSEIQLATQNLDESLVIGRGGFGKVYKGTITNSRANPVTVAIKRLDLSSNQGASEFWAEVNMLSNLRHCHLVSLIGYCNEGKEMILVYEYMSHGTLEDHLHRGQTPLSWMQRLAICIGAARGLDYLHTGTGIKHGIIHRDVKSSNILLHSSWAAKILDFGLSKICPKNKQFTYVNTAVKGTFGYLDPDYFYTGKLTRKSDVYAFGVVLFEVLCGKQAVDSSIDDDQWGLAIWAQDSMKEGRLKQIVDANIREVISPKCLKVFAQLAKRCLHKNPKERPTMSEIVAILESTLALQEKANDKLQPQGMSFFARKAPIVTFISRDENSGGRSLNSLELYFDALGGENRTLHRFDLDTISVATDNFSEANKISQHTRDSLFKGKLPNGQGIAVVEPCFGSKRNEYCMNEASLLVKLEHENVVKLLGYCIEETRLFLVYDFALYANLDHLMFDPGCTLLNWDNRYKIILGVARALLYLHRDAPVGVIHCDVKPGNILLDESLKPVLSSFWNARCLAVNETHGHVPRYVGTWGYTAPECLDSQLTHLSTGADIYSFGISVLETISGYRAAQIGTINQKLVDIVSSNWLEGTYSKSVDPRIDVDSSSMTRYIEIGLLCVQEDVAHRPTMEEVVDMLLGSSSLTLHVARMLARMTRVTSNYTIDPVNDYDITAVEDFISDLCPR